MSSIGKELGYKIKSFRKSNNLSTQYLAKQLNISTGLLNNIENARNDVFKLDLLLRITDVFNITLAELLEFDLNNIERVNTYKDGKIYIEFNIANTNNIVSNKITSSIKHLLDAYLELLREHNFNEESVDYINNYILQTFSLVKHINKKIMND